ncbi:MAG: penicillin-binding protein 2 [Burkholderiales bacterium]|nr:penicillin-binding protein 2 [Burkholderiales bacterium]
MGSVSVKSLRYATSPLLASKTPPWRSRFVVLLVGVGFAVLLGRAAYVQIVATQFFQGQGEKRFVYTQTLPASRGRILDRNGLVLATSVALPTVKVDTKLFAAETAQRKAIARLLGMTLAEFDERLEPGGTVLLRRHVEEAAWTEIKALAQAHGLKGFVEEREYRRRYPEGEAAAHVVGYTDTDDVGRAGVELLLQQQLQGHKGQRTVVRDRLGRVVEDVGDIAMPRHGSDITLSIDSKIQFDAWKRARDAVIAHNAKAASVVVLDSATGEVLAMANYPGADPNKRGSHAASLLQNRAASDASEPGSTMKPFTIARALESKRVTPNTPIDTAPGRLVVTGTTITDAHPHGTLTVSEVLQKSSNVGTAKLALAMERQELWETYAALGLGQKPRIEFPHMATGKLRAWKSWRPTDHARVGFGYSASASVLQMARAYTVFARNGDIAPLTLIKRQPAEGDGVLTDAMAASRVVPGQPVFSASTALQVREMLRLAASPGGTAPDLQRLTLGYSVAGKTGTAKKMVGTEYADGKYRAWFVGLAPVSAPRIVVAVMVDEPRAGKYYAGDVAAPVFSQVVQNTLRSLNVAPDVDVKTQISAKPVPAELESL